MNIITYFFAKIVSLYATINNIICSYFAGTREKRSDDLEADKEGNEN